ncbi:carbohydrate ABC transporter permease [Paenibacillus sp. J5C_2022]|uniref:carbohydrate ABC transporter permease n=1 Tax=Paenibacillus sp. J5C2022 TaxID=2977129 RepID=UPI0021CE93B9|nr:carbohydrate ABC transporter permease [Paenibacillus sp. J5C2022]MCU6712188.1 carbohydrate ABC transporter permease [Paenibacillus sp. J5C2022]
MRRRSLGGALFQTCNITFLMLLSMVTLYPFLNLLAISLNESLDTLRGGIHIVPRAFTLTNYELIFQNPRLFTAAWLSVARTVLGTVLSVGATIMVAYTLSRREYVLRKGLNAVIVVSMYVNGGIIPYYLLIKSLGLTNSFLVYIIPTLLVAFNVMIMRSYFEQLPEGLIESAKVEGANEFQILMRVVAPVSLPVIATITLFVSVQHWNSWMDNFLFNSRESLTLLQYELMKILLHSTEQINATPGNVDDALMRMTTPQSIRATMTIIVTVPILFVYPFMQKYFIKGMTLGAMKE